jgi:hypothetical protein
MPPEVRQHTVEPVEGEVWRQLDARKFSHVSHALMIIVSPYTLGDGGLRATHFVRNGAIKVFVTMYV